MAREQIQVIVPTDGASVSIPEILYTIEYLRGTYLFAVKHVWDKRGTLEASIAVPAATEMAADLSAGMAHHYPDRERLIDLLVEQGRSELPEEAASLDLSLVNIARRNPIELVLLGFATPLAVAVIVSGGKLHLGPLRVELPPLGKGLLELRKALQPLAPEKIQKRVRLKTPRLRN